MVLLSGRLRMYSQILDSAENTCNDINSLLIFGGKASNLPRLVVVY
jgi:hypothetical protein